MEWKRSCTTLTPQKLFSRRHGHQTKAMENKDSHTIALRWHFYHYKRKTTAANLSVYLLKIRGYHILCTKPCDNHAEFCLFVLLYRKGRRLLAVDERGCARQNWRTYGDDRKSKFLLLWKRICKTEKILQRACFTNLNAIPKGSGKGCYIHWRPTCAN